MKKVTPYSWLLVSLLGFILFVLVFAGLVMYNKRITLSTPVYFFLVIVLALIATAFLSGAMRSVARYSVTMQHKSLYIAGPALIFFIILYIGYRYRPAEPAGPLSLSILFSMPAGERPRAGAVYIRIAEYAAAGEISGRGAVLFTGINAAYKGQPVDIVADVEGFYIDTARGAYQLDDADNHTNLTIPLLRASYSTAVQGRVVSQERKSIPYAQIVFQGVDSTYTTDSLGKFSLRLPLRPGTETRIIVIKDGREIYNSLRTVTDHDFLSIAAN